MKEPGTPPGKPGTHLSTWILLIAAAGLLITGWALHAEMIHYQFACLVLTLISLVIAGFEIYRDGFYALFSPALWTTVGFGYFLFVGPLLNPLNLEAISEPQDLPFFFAILSIGVISYYAGYFIARSHRPTLRIGKFEGRLNINRVFNRTLLILAIFIGINVLIARAGKLAFFEYITTNAYLLGDKGQLYSRFDGGIGYYLLLLSRYFPLMITLPAAHLVRQDLPLWKRAVMLVGLLFVFIITLFAGGRMRLAAWLGAIGAYLVLHWARQADVSDPRAIFRKLAPVVLLGGAFIFLLTTLQIGYRSKRANIGAESIDLGEAVYDNLLDERTDQNVTLYRAVIADRDNELEHLWGESYALSFVAFIPRAIWPDKPGGDAMYAKLDVINPWGTNQNITHSVIGELIYNFTLAAVIPGMLLFGFLQGQLFNLFHLYKTNTRMILLYAAVVVPIAFFVRGEFHSTAGTMLYALSGLLFVLW